MSQKTKAQLLQELAELRAMVAKSAVAEQPVAYVAPRLFRCKADTLISTIVDHRVVRYSVFSPEGQALLKARGFTGLRVVSRR